MVEHLDDYRTLNEGRCECGRWSSRLEDGECPPCADHPRNSGAKAISAEFAARLGGGDLDPLDGDDLPPVA